MPAVEPVADRFGHGVGLVPHDRVPQNPAVILQRERHPPGQAEQVLRLHARHWCAGHVLAEVGVQPGGRSRRRPSRSRRGSASTCRRRRARGAPRGTLPASCRRRRSGSGSRPYWPGHAVVPLAPVGRAGDDAVRRAVRHAGEHVPGVSEIHGGSRSSVGSCRSRLPVPGWRSLNPGQGIGRPTTGPRGQLPGLPAAAVGPGPRPAEACADIRWYCKDTLSCTGRWTTARPPGPEHIRRLPAMPAPVPGKRRLMEHRQSGRAACPERRKPWSAAVPWRPPGPAQPPLSEIAASRGGEGAGLSFGDRAARRRTQDSTAADLITRSGRLLGQTLATHLSFFNLSLVLLGGGRSSPGRSCWPPVREGVYRRSLSLAARDLRISPSSLNRGPGLYGAAYIARPLVE